MRLNDLLRAQLFELLLDRIAVLLGGSLACTCNSILDFSDLLLLQRQVFHSGNMSLLNLAKYLIVLGQDMLHLFFGLLDDAFASGGNLLLVPFVISFCLSDVLQSLIS